MPDEISVYRLRIGLNYSRQVKVKGLDYLSNFELLIILSLLLLCNDPEKIQDPPSNLLQISHSHPVTRLHYSSI